MRSHVTWFVVLATASIAGPYLLGVRPRSRRDWTWVAIVLSFLAWVLLLMAPVRSR